MPAVVRVVFLQAVRQAQAAPKRAVKAAVDRPIPLPATRVLRAPAQNMCVRRTTLLAPHLQVPAEAAHRAEAITEATAPAVLTTEAAHLREAPLQVQAVAQVAATTAEAAAQVLVAATVQAEVAAVQEAEATARAAEVVRVAVEEDKYQPNFWI